MKSRPILTRLLRTPLSGGVLHGMRDADLPSVAVLPQPFTLHPKP